MKPVLGREGIFDTDVRSVVLRTMLMHSGTHAMLLIVSSTNFSAHKRSLFVDDD